MTSAPDPPTVAIDHASKRFGPRLALDRVCTDIGPGELVAVLGRSGAGKTTLLRALCRAIPLSEGTIRVGGDDIGALRGRALRAHRARIGMVYQQFNLVKRLRVIDNVLVGRLGRLPGWRRWAALTGCFARRDREIALRCLEHVGLLSHVWRRTDTLSGGEQQRVALARALAQEPRLIVADEPVASLDVVNGTIVMETLRGIASRTGLTVIASLHDVALARRYADRILGLREGRLVFDGGADTLTPAGLTEIFGRSAAAEEWAGLGEAVPVWAGAAAS